MVFGADVDADRPGDVGLLKVSHGDEVDQEVTEGVLSQGSDSRDLELDEEFPGFPCVNITEWDDDEWVIVVIGFNPFRYVLQCADPVNEIRVVGNYSQESIDHALIKEVTGFFTENTDRVVAGVGEAVVAAASGGDFGEEPLVVALPYSDGGGGDPVGARGPCQSPNLGEVTDASNDQNLWLRHEVARCEWTRGWRCRPMSAV